MRKHTISALLLVVAAIHLLPVSGLFGAAQLASLYGIAVGDSNLAILMRHRAVLFGILGVFVTYAAFRPALQPLAFVAGFASIVSFLYLALSAADYNAQIQRVVVADVVALIALVTAVILFSLGRRP